MIGGRSGEASPRGPEGRGPNQTGKGGATEKERGRRGWGEGEGRRGLKGEERGRGLGADHGSGFWTRIEYTLQEETQSEAIPIAGLGDV